ncbi:hypothetical protein CHI07_15420 [Paenibacillus sp. 7884-2]|nr:hypothetical protein CHI07_15420 [Paenibacillus sp. 7884-2]
MPSSRKQLHFQTAKKKVDYSPSFLHKKPYIICGQKEDKKDQEVRGGIAPRTGLPQEVVTSTFDTGRVGS